MKGFTLRKSCNPRIGATFWPFICSIPSCRCLLIKNSIEQVILPEEEQHLTFNLLTKIFSMLIRVVKKNRSPYDNNSNSEGNRDSDALSHHNYIIIAFYTQEKFNSFHSIRKRKSCLYQSMNQLAACSVISTLSYN